MAFFSKSPWIIHYDGSSCNGCDIEVLASLMPRFDVERFGVVNTGNPKHADILLLTGAINEQNRSVVQNIYAQMPEPKVVVAVGICATSGGIFRECYNVMGGADKLLPVDVYVPNCPVRPEALIDAVVMAVGILEKKRADFLELGGSIDAVKIEPAVLQDAEELLALQRLAYQSEAELYGDKFLSPLSQTLSEIREDMKKWYFLKALSGRKIVGSVRAYMEGSTCHIGRLCTHPGYQGRGIGRKLMETIEAHFSQAGSYQTFAGHKSFRNIFFHQKLGYNITKTEKVNELRSRVYMEKAVRKEQHVTEDH